jgi:hypothetical protein
VSDQLENRSEDVSFQNPTQSAENTAEKLGDLMEGALELLKSMPQDQIPQFVLQATCVPSLLIEPQNNENEIKAWPRLRPVSLLDANPIWASLGSLQRMHHLLPDSYTGVSRMDQCIAMLRGEFGWNLLPDVPAGDGVDPILYPQIELNWLVDATRTAILSLLDYVDIESTIRQRLRNSLIKGEPFLNHDDRGTMEGAINPSGMTKDKENNSLILDALADFLHSLRQQPYALIRYSIHQLNQVAVPPVLLSVDLSECEITFRSKVYEVSEPACYLIHLLLAARGGFVSSGDLKKHLKSKRLWEEGQLRMDRLRKQLPHDLKNAILSDRRGYFLDGDKLLSYV